MIFSATEGKVRLDSGNVPYIKFGRGAGTLVMIPGLRLSDISGSAGAAAWYYRIFAKDYTVYMFDKKDNLSSGCTVHDLAGDVAEAMKKLNLGDACVFGASQGGMIGQELAINHPESVSKLVLAVTLSRTNETVQNVINHWISLAKEGGLSAVAEDYIYKGYSEKYINRYRAVLPLFIKTQKFMPAERFIVLAKACLTCNTYDKLDNIKCPVLVLGGGKDKVVTVEASLEIAEKLNCEYYIYEDLGHEAYNEAKDFNKRIYEFFAD
ncbi:MAG: alpha/beta hydrolase [Clostridiales bacterium]|nr:alpha/beta hydrolase [Clostridiales bacterium]